MRWNATADAYPQLSAGSVSQPDRSFALTDGELDARPPERTLHQGRRPASGGKLSGLEVAHRDHTDPGGAREIGR